MQNITDEEIKVIRFRRSKLLELTEQLELMISGREKSILPYIQSGNGKYSEKKTWRFIERLIECLERYLQYEYEETDYILSEQEKEFYKSFLYCTIRAGAFELYDMRIMARCKTMDDICKMAEDAETTRIQRDVDLFFEEIYEPVTGGFFGYMDNIYKVLTGDDITSVIREEERARMRQALESEVCKKEQVIKDYEDEIYEPLRRQGITEEMDEFLKESAEEAMQQLWEIAPEEMAKEQQYFEKEERIKETKADSLVYKETFLEQYLLYRKRYFEVEHRRLASNVEGMFELFLYDEELSHYGEEDNFLTAYTLLNRTIRQVKKLI